MVKFSLDILPARLTRILRAWKYRGWQGDYRNWEEAMAASSGYDSDEIIEKVRRAALVVKAGKAAFERDSVLFYGEEFNWPLVAAVMTAAAAHGRLNVLDFGGSLGSLWFQHKKYFKIIEDSVWNIVEQEKFVHIGRAEFEDQHLQFFNSAPDAIASNGKPSILILSSTIQYLREPYKVLANLCRLKIPYLFVDNSYFSSSGRDRLTVQTVPEEIYSASYPAWFLDYRKVIDLVSQYYEIVHEHQNDLYIFLDGEKIYYQGFFARLKSL